MDEVARYLRDRERKIRHARGNFGRSLRMMHSTDPDEAESGFNLLADIAPEHAADLIATYRAEPADGEKAWLLELIGLARSPLALDLFVHELDNERLSHWAERGLKLLDTKEAREALRRWRGNADGFG